MQKSKFITIFVILLIFVYIITSQFYLYNLGNLFTFIINPLFFIIIAFILKMFILPPYSTNKHKKEIIQYVFITVLIYIIVYLLSGLVIGFGNNPYSTTLRSLVTNFFTIGTIVFCREYIRYKLLNNVYNNDKTLIFILLVIVFSLIDFNLHSLFTSSENIYYIFKSIFYTLLPSIIKNVLFTYISMHTDYVPAVLYELLYYLMLWISPILPSSPWILESILSSIFPLILLLYCRYYIHKKNRFHLNTFSQPINPIKLFPFSILLICSIWFALGIFPIKPVGIATASMLPELHVGDVAIVKKCTPNDIKEQDIIEYQMEGYTVIHRVVKINQNNGEFYFTTKGDNNDSEDKLPVLEEQLIGKVLFKIRYLALPTVWINNFSNKVQIDIETGK